MPRNSQTTQGFTLLELLVVIIIISIASTIIVLKAGTYYYSAQRAEFFAKEMASMIALAKNQGIFSMDVLGFQISSGQYEVVRLDEGNEPSWKPLGATDSFWAARNIPADMMVTVQVDNPNQANLFQNIPLAPQIIIMPSGELTPFTITIHKQGSARTYMIQGTATGNIQVNEAK